MKIVLVFLFGVFCVTASRSSQTPDMVLIPAGEFQMGSNSGERDEKPVHTVYLDAFYIDKHEVTVAEYKRFVEATGPPTATRVCGADLTDRSAPCSSGQLARCDGLCKMGR